MQKIKIIGHRGASGEAYENTMEAFDLAVKQKADMIELDTHRTKDGEYIVYHDYTVKENGEQLKIAEATLEKIREVKLPNGEQIPLLKEVIEKYLPQIELNIEIKSEIKSKEFMQLIKDTEVDQKRILITSFKREVLEELKDIKPKAEFQMGLLYIIPFCKIKKMAKKEYLDAVNPYYMLLTKRRVKDYKKMGKKVNAWTIDKERSIARLIEIGVDGIITNYPRKTRKIVEKIIAEKE